MSKLLYLIPGISLFLQLKKKRDRRLSSCFSDEHTGNKCEVCGKAFKKYEQLLFTCNCDWCGRIVCSGCRGYLRPHHSCTDFQIRFCNQCNHDEITAKINEVICVRSDHVGQHNTVRRFNYIQTGWWNSLNDAEYFLRASAVKLGANAILKYYYKRDKSQDGNYIYSIFRATGVPAIINKKAIQRIILS